LVSVNTEFHNITLSNTSEVLVLTSAYKLPLCDFIGRFMFLVLAQGFRLVTSDLFSSCELGGV